ncbi:XRE family transcriptional regulator [Paraburkholderia sp. Ac-20340]|uniref:XRE family transcriptional regulator n=1 Tax=Paraburkholderia sp. Ac-20340 TaxID=2703888 RepID=UPI001980AC7E|nr:XRE family transcriptional regulator [Paraburkholderia sp. Ac-20340]MBN3852021.1 XRE family transcriptional regulator [Paraburkholderia sp. Ac-20340]
MNPSYVPPTPEDLLRLADELGNTRTQMAALAHVSTGRQWAKYTWGDKTPEADRRDLGFDKAFLIAARLELMKGPIKNIEQIHERMRSFGCFVGPDVDGEPQL